MKITQAKLSDLRPHPKNIEFFTDPKQTPQYEDIKNSIKAQGIQEPLIIKADGTILSGHVRFSAATELGLETVPVRIHNGIQNEGHEVQYLIKANTERRQLTLEEIGKLYKYLKETPVEEGGCKTKRGRRSKQTEPKLMVTAPDTISDNPDGESIGHALFGGPSQPQVKVSPGDTFKGKVRNNAAKQANIGRKTGEALATVFTEPGVPEEVKKAVKENKIAPTVAAKGIKEGLPVEQILNPPPKPEKVSPGDTINPKTVEMVTAADTINSKPATLKEAMLPFLKELDPKNEAYLLKIRETIDSALGKLSSPLPKTLPAPDKVSSPQEAIKPFLEDESLPNCMQLLTVWTSIGKVISKQGILPSAPPPSLEDITKSLNKHIDNINYESYPLLADLNKKLDSAISTFTEAELDKAIQPTPEPNPSEDSIPFPTDNDLLEENPQLLKPEEFSLNLDSILNGI